MNNGILLFMPKLYYGGAETQFRYFIEYCNEKKIKLYVIVENKDDNENKDAFIKNNPNIGFLEYNFNFLEKYGKKGLLVKITNLIEYIFSIFKTKKLLKKNNKINYCIAYVGLGVKLFWFLKLYNIKCIFSERSAGVDICKKRFNCFNLKLADKICANSISGSNYMSRKFNCEVPVIYNGVRIPDKIEKSNGEKKKFVILVSARIAKIKNIFSVVKAINKIDFGKKIEVFFCGGIEDKEYYNEICEYVDRNRLQHCVHFEGFVNNMGKYYTISDLVILPSFLEGMPNAILESFANKKMVISSNIEMNAAIMEDELYMFNPNSDNELSDKIRMIMDMSDNEKEKRIEDRYKFVKENFSVEKMAESFLKLLE